MKNKFSILAISLSFFSLSVLESTLSQISTCASPIKKETKTKKPNWQFSTYFTHQQLYIQQPVIRKWFSSFILWVQMGSSKDAHGWRENIGGPVLWAQPASACEHTLAHAVCQWRVGRCQDSYMKICGILTKRDLCKRGFFSLSGGT